MFEFIINIILVMRLHAIYDRSYKSTFDSFRVLILFLTVLR